MLDGSLVAEDLVVQYSDLHPLHGGVAYEASGSGRVTRYLRGGDERQDRILAPAQLPEFVALLVTLVVWEQAGIGTGGPARREPGLPSRGRRR